MEQQRKSGLAITSLVLGISSYLCLGPLTAIPAVITGHIALNRSKKEPEIHGGGSQALAGLILGYINLALSVVMVPILAGMFIPAFAKAKQRAQSIMCVNNMKQITLAARMVSMDKNDVFPSDFQSMTNELGSPRVLVCPTKKEIPATITWSSFNWSDVTYEMLAPGAKGNEGETVYLRCPIHGHTANVDGSVIQNRKK